MLKRRRKEGIIDEEVLNNLKKLFHLPLKLAAKELKICPTNMKKLCREYGIVRWPSRRLKSYDSNISILKFELSKNKNVDKITADIQTLEEERASIYSMSDLKFFKESKIISTKKQAIPLLDKPLIKPLIREDYLLISSCFYESNKTESYFSVLHKSILYRLVFGKRVMCTCGNLLPCEHVKFILKRLFFQKQIKLTFGVNDLVKLKEDHEENRSSYNCSICLNSVFNCEDIFSFEDGAEFAHIKCLSTCYLFLKDKKTEDNSFQIFCHNIENNPNLKIDHNGITHINSSQSTISKEKRKRSCSQSTQPKTLEILGQTSPDPSSFEEISFETVLNQSKFHNEHFPLDTHFDQNELFETEYFQKDTLFDDLIDPFEDLNFF